MLHGRYYATKLIGQGGFGRTYQAVDTHNVDGKLCVIKQFIYQSASSAANKTAINLFYQEAEHLKSLGNHPQIPTLVDVFDEDGKSYLVQEYIDGDNLQQELSIEGRFSQGQIREILESLLPVLDWFHHRSIPVIHRDIKPANIIRRRSDGQLVLVDFGAAKLASETLLAKTGTSIGSAEYAAPEQVRGKATFASDVYSLGATCIHLLTLVSPWDLQNGDNEWAWRDFLGDNKVDEKLGDVIDKMIDPALSRRYRTALEALADLKNSQASTPVAIDLEILREFQAITKKSSGGILNILTDWNRLKDRHSISAIQEDRLMYEALSILPISSLPSMNAGGLISVLVVSFFNDMVPFQRLIVKHFLLSMSDLSLVVISLIYGVTIVMSIRHFFLESRCFYAEGSFREMAKSLVKPWLILFLIQAVDTLLASLFRY